MYAISEKMFCNFHQASKLFVFHIIALFFVFFLQCFFTPKNFHFIAIDSRRGPKFVANFFVPKKYTKRILRIFRRTASFLMYGRKSSQSVFFFLPGMVFLSKNRSSDLLSLSQAFDSRFESPLPSARDRPATPLASCFSECSRSRA